MPILEKEGLDGLDPDEAATEQSRQRLKMQVRRCWAPPLMRLMPILEPILRV